MSPDHYTSPAKRGLGGVARIIRDVPPELLYLNSFFSPGFTIFPLTARRRRAAAFRLQDRESDIHANRRPFRLATFGGS